MSGNPDGSRSSAGRFATGLLTLRYTVRISWPAFHWRGREQKARVSRPRWTRPPWTRLEGRGELGRHAASAGL